MIACASGKKQNRTEPIITSTELKELDTVLKEAADNIAKYISQNIRIALLDFDAPSDKMTTYVLDELATNLVQKRKYTVVDRKEIDLILREQGLQRTGEFSDQTAEEMGKLLGAQYIVSGSYTDLGTYCRILIRVLSVKTASIEVQHRDDVQKNLLITELLKGGKTVHIPMEAPKTPSYKVGDKGPSGGYIFFDKGSLSDGWRYLEAAHEDFEFKILWSSTYDNITTFDAVGTGSKNTERIVKFYDDKGKKDTAAHRCAALNIKGFKDWFLPSKDELNLMHKNLAAKKLGFFQTTSDIVYWSSTQSNVSLAWYQNIKNGNQDHGNKNHPYRVRPVRAF